VHLPVSCQFCVCFPSKGRWSLVVLKVRATCVADSMSCWLMFFTQSALSSLEDMKQAVNSGQTVTDRTHRERSPQSQKKQFLLDRHVPFLCESQFYLLTWAMVTVAWSSLTLQCRVRIKKTKVSELLNFIKKFSDE